MTEASTSPPVPPAASACLARLPRPGASASEPPWRAHSLAGGDIGIALAHVERARHGADSWHQARRWIEQACAAPVGCGPDTGLFQGLPAIVFVLHATGRQPHALADTHVALGCLAHDLAQATHARIAAGRPAIFREYDVFFGLAGIGALLLRLAPHGGAMEHVLTAVVALTRPRRIDESPLPGWWVEHDPHRRQSPQFPGGHANLGIAHGITGPLALLALAARNGTTVDGQTEAIDTILEFLDTWRQDGPNGAWWPQWISRSELTAKRPAQTAPGRPSWCYGTPGIARAGQLAAIAIGDTHAQGTYEDALVACLSAPVQQALLTDAGLCHGAAGVHQTAWHAARDALNPDLATHLPAAAHRLRELASRPHAHGPGFLEGDAGTLLALHTTTLDLTDPPPASGWDACLLLT
ncbi:lanthionine synthetase C family protein [Embleya sp. NPDC059259]|uniref:lanthionine synthetase C family protein n=1 Tax=unclassified Embleya TaxID=2699296 RepID=UPI003680BB81